MLPAPLLLNLQVARSGVWSSRYIKAGIDISESSPPPNCFSKPHYPSFHSWYEQFDLKLKQEISNSTTNDPFRNSSTWIKGFITRNKDRNKVELAIIATGLHGKETVGEILDNGALSCLTNEGGGTLVFWWLEVIMRLHLIKHRSMSVVMSRK